MNNLVVMESTEGFTSQLYLVLSDVSHPLEGTFYLFLLALFFRWRWPIMWNKLLRKISAPAEESTNEDHK